MYWIAILLVVVVLIAIWLWVVERPRFQVSTRRYKAVFARAHYDEVARALEGLRREALNEMEELPEGDSHPPSVVTSGEMALSYSIDREDDHYIHHLAISLPGHVTPHAVGDRFAIFLADRLGIQLDRVWLGASRSTVHHMEFRLEEAEQAEIVSRPIRVPSDAEIERVAEEFKRGSVVCHPMKMPAV